MCMHEHEAIIAIVGAPGSGKSTFARLLSETFGTHARYETPEGNPYIQDASLTSTHLLENQLWFLQQSVSRLLTAQTIQQTEHVGSILDTLPQTNILFSRLLLDPSEYAKFEIATERPLESMPMPDLLIFLRDDPHYLMERIRARNRPLDDLEAISFISDLQRLHDSWIDSIPETLKIILRSRNLEDQNTQEATIQTIRHLAKTIHR